MRRITVAMARKAYERTGLVPCGHSFWIERSDGAIGACVVGALYFDATGEPARDAERIANICDVLDISPSYLSGLADGFDYGGGVMFSDGLNDEYDAGTGDGARIHRALLGGV